jgi:hypothetical protein
LKRFLLESLWSIWVNFESSLSRPAMAGRG